MSTNEKSNKRGGNTPSGVRPKRTRKSQSKKGDQKGKSQDLPNKEVLTEGSGALDSGNIPVPEEGQEMNINTNVPTFKNEAIPEIDYSNTVEQPKKVSQTVPPAGRVGVADPYKGQPITLPEDIEVKQFETIKITDGKRTQNISRQSWNALKEGSTGGWKEVAPSTPPEVKNIKKPKK
jgi:hypothetical protein